MDKNQCTFLNTPGQLVLAAKEKVNIKICPVWAIFSEPGRIYWELMS